MLCRLLTCMHTYIHHNIRPTALVWVKDPLSPWDRMKERLKDSPLIQEVLRRYVYMYVCMYVNIYVLTVYVYVDMYVCMYDDFNHANKT